MKPIKRTGLRSSDGAELVLYQIWADDLKSAEYSWEPGDMTGRRTIDQRRWPRIMEMIGATIDTSVRTHEEHHAWCRAQRVSDNAACWRQHGMCYGDHYNATVSPPDYAIFPDAQNTEYWEGAQ